MCPHRRLSGRVATQAAVDILERIDAAHDSGVACGRVTGQKTFIDRCNGGCYFSTQGWESAALRLFIFVRSGFISDLLALHRRV